MTETLKGINAGLAFILELAMLIALGYWGFSGDKSVSSPLVHTAARRDGVLRLSHACSPCVRHSIGVFNG